MVRTAEIQHTDDQNSEHVQLDDYYIDDYGDYFSDTPSQNTNAKGSFNSSDYLNTP